MLTIMWWILKKIQLFFFKVSFLMQDIIIIKILICMSDTLTSLSNLWAASTYFCLCFSKTAFCNSSVCLSSSSWLFSFHTKLSRYNTKFRKHLLIHSFSTAVRRDDDLLYCYLAGLASSKLIRCPKTCSTPVGMKIILSSHWFQHLTVWLCSPPTPGHMS